MDEQTPPAPIWRSLLHRWFVQYNPIYLVSAILVLAGTMLTSRGLSEEGSLHGQLGVALVAEVYAAALVAAAAFLMRLEQRRPAVMLALLAVLYQGDLTLHTETCAYLGLVGVVASALWCAFFVGKLLALGWALRVRFGARALVTATIGALALAIAPALLPHLDSRGAGAFVALVVFALGSLCPRTTEQTVVSKDALDDWGRTVLGRTVRATWVIWGSLFGLHTLFWASERSMQLGLVLPAVLLLLSHRVQSELRRLALVFSVLGLTMVIAPGASSLVALLCACAFARRMFGQTLRAVPGNAGASERAPYRGHGEDRAPTAVTEEWVPVAPAERARMAGLALGALYLSVWTTSWQGGAMPVHQLWLDVAFTVAVVLAALVLRRRALVGTTAIPWAHWALSAGLVPAPHTQLAWGATALAGGFVLLAAALLVSYRLRDPSLPSRAE
jgi:hypothetical protein